MNTKKKVIVYNNASNFWQGHRKVIKCKEFIKASEDLELVKCCGDYHAGRTKIQRKRAVKKVIKYCKKFGIEIVVTASASSISRSIPEFIWFMNELKKIGVEILLADSNTYGTEIFPMWCKEINKIAM